MIRALLLIIVLTLPPIATIGLTEYRKDARYPRRFAEAMPGKIYRGGRPTASDIRNLSQDQKIRTVVNLTEETPEEKPMLDTIRDLRLGFVRVPMPGDGRGDFESLDMAADAIANQNNWPVFFHCAAGKQRSNASWAAYRLKYGRMTIDQVLAELEQKYDLSRTSESELCEHLRRYSLWLAARSQPSGLSTTPTPVPENPNASRP